MSVLDNYTCTGQLSIEDVFGPDIWCGKTSPEPSVQTMEKTSVASSKKQRGSSIKMPLFLDLVGGGKVVSFRSHYGRRVEHCLACT